MRAICHFYSACPKSVVPKEYPLLVKEFVKVFLTTKPHFEFWGWGHPNLLLILVDRPFSMLLLVVLLRWCLTLSKDNAFYTCLFLALPLPTQKWPITQPIIWIKSSWVSMCQCLSLVFSVARILRPAHCLSRVPHDWKWRRNGPACYKQILNYLVHLVLSTTKLNIFYFHNSKKYSYATNHSVYTFL